ncbi:hypothetical protein ACGC1H_005344 [Rhizoctonia solani]
MIGAWTSNANIKRTKSPCATDPPWLPATALSSSPLLLVPHPQFLVLMPSYGGYYATQAECQAWLRVHAPEIIEKIPQAGARAVENKAKAFMSSKRIRDSFFLETLPLPGPRDPEIPWGLMLVRCSSAHKEYLPPVRERDYLLRDLIESKFQLKVSDWTVLWYSEHDRKLVTEFLSPGTVSSDE